MAKEDKLKALEAAIAQIEKQYGRGSVMKLGESRNEHVEIIPPPRAGCHFPSSAPSRTAEGRQDPLR